jgi:hypothetical protein
MRGLKRAEANRAKDGRDPAQLLPHTDRTLVDMLRQSRVPPGKLPFRLRTLLDTLADAVAQPSEPLNPRNSINWELALYHAASPIFRPPDAQLPAQ